MGEVSVSVDFLMVIVGKQTVQIEQLQKQLAQAQQQIGDLLGKINELQPPQDAPPQDAPPQDAPK